MRGVTLQHGQPPHCAHHPNVLMVQSGIHTAWSTVRYACPLCLALGRGPVEMARGVICAYWPGQDAGLIEAGTTQLPFRRTDLDPTLRPAVGTAVTCEVEEDARGLVARRVRPWR